MRILAQPAFSNRAGNPYNWLLYTHMMRLGVEVCEFSRLRLLTGAYDVWHLHWPEGPLSHNRVTALGRLIELLVMMKVSRWRGIKIVWTVHNLAAHEKRHPRIARWFWRSFVSHIDGYVSLSAAGHGLAIQTFAQLARLPGFIVPHGHYRGVYPDDPDAERARARLSLEPDAVVIAFVGQLRGYKGVPALCCAFSQLPDGGARLLIAGATKSPELADELRRYAAADPRIRLHLGFIPDADLHLYMRAADLIVLPYVSVLNSGGAVLALSFDRPILVPHTGALTELRDQVGPEWARTYAGELSRDVLAEAMSWARLPRTSDRPRLDSFEWPLVARQTLDALKAIAGLASQVQGPSASHAPSNDRPTVSVVIPVFNRPSAVRRSH